MRLIAFCKFRPENPTEFRVCLRQNPLKSENESSWRIAKMQKYLQELYTLEPSTTIWLLADTIDFWSLLTST